MDLAAETVPEPEESRPRMADRRQWTPANDAKLVQLARQSLPRVEIARRLERTFGIVGETREQGWDHDVQFCAFGRGNAAPEIAQVF